MFTRSLNPSRQSVGKGLRWTEAKGRQPGNRRFQSVREILQVPYFQSLAELAASPSWLLKCTSSMLSNSGEELMQLSEFRKALAAAAFLVTISLAGTPSFAQETAEPERQAPMQPPQPQRQKADGERRGLPLEAYAVVPGTKFLVKLEDDLSTKDTRENEKFKVKTLEPLEAGSGIYLPSGAEIHGHISHVEPAGVAGRAKLWLTFDEIRPIARRADRRAFQQPA